LRALPGLLLSSGPISKGKYLYRAGDPADGQVHLRSGMVKTYAISAEGDEYVTGFHLPGDVLGCAQKEGRHAESAIALELSTACLLSEAAMDQLGQMGGGGLLWQQLAQRDALGVQHQINLTQTTSQARFAGFCTAYAQRLQRLGRRPDYLPTPMSRTDIATYLGMTLASLSRVMSKLQKAGVVRAARDYIEVLQPETMRTLGIHAA
jgi:CRP/FNR family transcriptional regulator